MLSVNHRLSKESVPSDSLARNDMRPGIIEYLHT
jgi:hypothetical protein